MPRKKSGKIAEIRLKPNQEVESERTSGAYLSFRAGEVRDTEPMITRRRAKRDASLGQPQRRLSRYIYSRNDSSNCEARGTRRFRNLPKHP